MLAVSDLLSLYRLNPLTRPRDLLVFFITDFMMKLLGNSTDAQHV